MADLYAITGDEQVPRGRPPDRTTSAVLDPLMDEQDRLTGLHANTQIPKVIGLERIALLILDDDRRDGRTGARFFWDTVVTRDRSVAFGGNSVSEHFQPDSTISAG